MGSVRSSARYYLKEPFSGTYLTAREAEAMTHFILGKTIRATAMAMQLSPRTVEFYLNNIKRKFKCRTKAALIEKAISSGFSLQFVTDC